MDNLEQLKYPTGTFSVPKEIGASQIGDWIEQLNLFPAKLRAAVAVLTDEQMDTPYRPGGWTLRQVVHHLPDSHLNAYLRFKLALTEDNPVIKPYYEDRWAETAEAKNGPVAMSLDLLGALHNRWVALLRTVAPGQFKRTYFHPENNKTYALDVVLALYVWHGEHHLAHITETVKRHNW